MSRHTKILELANYFLILAAASNKEYKDLYKEVIKSDPKLQEHVRQKTKERQKRFQENHKNDPNYIESLTKQRQETWNQIKNDKASGSLTGLLVKLRRQVAESKYNLIRTNKPTEVIDNFVVMAEKIYTAIELMKSYTQDHTIDVVNLLPQCEELLNVTSKWQTINNTVKEICNKLHEEVDLKQFI